MLNVRGVLSSCLFVTVAIAGSAFTVLAQSPASWSGVIDVIFGRKEPRDPNPTRRGGPRPPDLCWITPTEKVWNTRPVFVWQGDTRLIGVRAEEEEKVLWQQVAPINKDSTGQTPVRYFIESKTSLQPGNYEWLFFDPTTRSLRIRVPFQVMGGKERAATTAGLAKLNANLKTTGSNGEEIALQRAKFFAKRRLWTDAIQQVYSVKKPSAQLQQVVQEIEKETCESKEKAID